MATADDGTLSGKGRTWPALDGMKPLAASCAAFAWRTAAGKDAGSLKLSWLRGCSSCRRKIWKSDPQPVPGAGPSGGVPYALERADAMGVGCL